MLSWHLCQNDSTLWLSIHLQLAVCRVESEELAKAILFRQSKVHNIAAKRSQQKRSRVNEFQTSQVLSFLKKETLTVGWLVEVQV